MKNASKSGPMVTLGQTLLSLYSDSLRSNEYKEFIFNSGGETKWTNFGEAGSAHRGIRHINTYNGGLSSI